MLAARLEQSLVTKARQQRIEQDWAEIPVDQPPPELAQHREVEARVGQLQAEAVFPIDPAAHRLGRLSVGQAFDVLENADKG